MSAVVFDSGDKPFMEWMAANPDGFVLNTHPLGGSSYIRFHRSTCRHIGRHEIARANAYTTNAYIKVCSNSLSDLIDWATTNRKGATAYVTCKTCGVDIDSLTTTLPEEISQSTIHIEGAIRKIKVNAYERNPLAREACLKHYGLSCVACGFNFEKTFGKFAQGFIHVHHLIPMSDIGGSYEVDPIKDLRPVCPNCHAAIHIGGKVRSIEEIKKLLSA